ncbi:AI-2E family transporter [Luteimonas vadosa]|uniref:AI-2E family transporter n=1 Tax=Luteimonas vadosa TaxID=1165507 RepID=A0ABP9DSP5_9GAMM
MNTPPGASQTGAPTTESTNGNGAPRPRATAAALVLATLAVGFTLWAAQALILPVLLAVFFAMVGNPILRLLQRLYVPRFLAAMLVVFGGLAVAGMLGSQLARPAAQWMEQAPRQMRQVSNQLRDLAKPVQRANEAAETIARAAGGETGTRPQVVKTQVDDPYGVVTRGPKVVAAVFAVVLLTFFFMVFGEKLQRSAIALLPTRQRQKITVGILQSIEHEISRYVFTITLINIVVGLIFAALLHLVVDVDLQEALLWGTMVALLNYAPYVGPAIGILLMLVVGFVTWNEIGPSLVPAGMYLGLNIIEGQLLTPIILGQRMALSPLVIILALMLFGWLWGIVGLLLAVPLLVCVKLVLAKLEGMEGWARLLE